MGHGLPTPLDKVPEEVKVNFALRQSLQEWKHAGLDTTLLCEVPDCHTRTGHPRHANHLCERVPRACMPCCKRLGGCKKHPLHAGDLNGLLSPSLGSHSNRSRESPVPSSSQVPMATPVQFACPLPADYGHAYVANHQARQERAEQAAALLKAHGDLMRAVTIIFWDGTPANAPWVHRVQSEQPGQISLILHPDVVQHWVSQSIQVPIPVSTSGRILIRSLNATDEDCHDLKTEIDCVTDITPLAVTHKHMRPSSHVEEPSKKMSKQSSSESIRRLEPDEMPVVQDTGVDLSKLPFRYVCTHVPGMEIMLNVENGIADAFHEAFPVTTYIQSTFYKVQGLYRQAHELGILAKYIAYGQSVQGLWSEMHKEVESDVVVPQTMPDDAPLPLPGHSPSPSRNTLLYTNVMTPTSLRVTKEWVGFHPFGGLDDDPIKDFPEDNPQVCVWLPRSSQAIHILVDSADQVIGHVKDCVKLVAHKDDTTVIYVAKRFHGHPNFRQDALILAEALRMGEAALRWDHFVHLASDYSVHVARESELTSRAWTLLTNGAQL
ncbi:hypothetical protein K439DRAFT_1622731 [Ramaria rubella]|nr:hypothetical protein K439DRAFT_1622731 [Ramaria rubella]